MLQTPPQRGKIIQQTVEEEKEQTLETAKPKKKAAVQLFSPDKIKVLYREQTEKLRSKVIPDGDFQNIIKKIMKGHSNQNIANVIYKSQLKEPLLNNVIKDLNKEMKCFSSTKQFSSLRKTSSDDLATFDFKSWNWELQLNTPLLYKIISTFYHEQNPTAVTVTAALILKQRNMHMSAFHHVMSQILDNGGATDECINILNKLGFCVSASAAGKKKADLMTRQGKHVDQLVVAEKKAYEEKTGEDTVMSCDIVGDNFDISKKPSHMSKEKQNKSWHWFMLVGLQKRVLSRSLENHGPVLPVTEVENSIFIPSVNNCGLLEKNFTFHIMKVLVKYLACFKKFESCLPKYIVHPHILGMSKKSDFVLLNC